MDNDGRALGPVVQTPVKYVLKYFILELQMLKEAFSIRWVPTLKTCSKSVPYCIVAITINNTILTPRSNIYDLNFKLVRERKTLFMSLQYIERRYIIFSYTPILTSNVHRCPVAI